MDQAGVFARNANTHFDGRNPTTAKWALAHFAIRCQGVEMFVRLSRNTFFRQYGPYSYLYDQTTRSDEIYEDAEPFLRDIVSGEKDYETLENKVVGYFVGNEDVIRHDFQEFLSHLCEEGFVVKGESLIELDQADKGFTYSDSSPKTAPDLKGKNLDQVADDEHNLLRTYFEKHPTPFGIHIDLTSECNERCVHCYVPKNRHFYIDAKKACEVLDQFREMNGLQVTLSGGECLLHPDFELIIRHARGLGLSVSVLSNLTLLSDNTAELFKEMNLSLVQTSLYSMNGDIHDDVTGVHGSFTKTKRAIEKLHRLDVPVQIACPCMKLNYRGYREVIKYAQSMKMKSVTDFIMMARSDGTTDNLKQRLNLSESESVMRAILENEPEMKIALTEYRVEIDPKERANEPMCGVGINSICLNADGNYYPCSGFQGFTLGNYRENTLSSVWLNSSQILYLRNLRKRDIPKCVHCKDAGYCSMCLARNFNETGDMLNVAEHFCKIAEKNHELVDEYRRK